MKQKEREDNIKVTNKKLGTGLNRRKSMSAGEFVPGIPLPSKRK